MFKKFECGCIGFVVRGMEIKPEDKVIWLVKPCDTRHDDPDYCLTYQRERSTTLAGKPSRKLEEQEIEKVLADLHDLISDGYRFRSIQAALGLS